MKDKDEGTREKAQKNLLNALIGLQQLFSIQNLEAVNIFDHLFNILSIPIKSPDLSLLPDVFILFFY